MGRTLVSAPISFLFPSENTTLRKRKFQRFPDTTTDSPVIVFARQRMYHPKRMLSGGVVYVRS
jgi:hypothetical protein